MIKDIFIELQSEAMNFPFVSDGEIVNFCRLTGMFDSQFKMEHAMVYCAGTIQLQMGTIPKKAGFVRSEFLEFLVRVCRAKFLD